MQIQNIPLIPAPQIRPEYTSAVQQIPVPHSHDALEHFIRLVQGRQNPFMLALPEEKLQQKILQISQYVFQALSVTNNLRGMFGIGSLSDAAITAMQDRDCRDGRVGTEADLPHIITKLKTNSIGLECLLRVVHAISALAQQGMLPSVVRDIDRREILKSALILGAQKLDQELQQENAYTCSLIVDDICRSIPRRQHRHQPALVATK